MDYLQPAAGDGSPPKAVAAMRKHLSRSSSRSQSPIALQVTTGHLQASNAPVTTGISRHSRGEDRALANDLTQLRAAFYVADGQLQQPQQHLQPGNSGVQQPNSSVNSQQLQQNTSSHRAQVSTASTRGPVDLTSIAEQLQERTGRLSSIQTKQQQINARLLNTRPSLSRQGESAGDSLLTTSQEGQVLVRPPDVATSRPGSSSSFARVSSPLQQHEVVPTLNQQLATLQEQLKAATRAVAVSKSAGTISSRNSSTEQPLTPALVHQNSQQQSQLSAAAAAQQLAVAGMSQLQEVTQMSQQMRQISSNLGTHAADVQSKLLGLEAFFNQHPELQSAAALQHLTDTNKRLKQDLFAKQQSLSAALHALREQTHTPADKRANALQKELQHLKDQLLAKDAALATSEEEIRRLRRDYNILEPSGSDFSPSPLKLTDGAAADSGHTVSSDIARRLNFSMDNPLHDSRPSSSSGSSANGSPQQQHQQQGVPASVIKQLAASHQAALDAKDLQVQQLQRQVADLQTKQEAMLQRQQQPVAPAAVQQQLRKLAKPRTLDEALQQLTSLNEIINKQYQQMTEQEQQASARAAERETSFKRQLEVEKRQHEFTRKSHTIITEQLEQLQERLAKSQAQELQLQRQLEQAQDKLQEAAVAVGTGTAGRRTEVDHIRQLQQHVQDQKQQIQRLQGCIQSLHGLIKDADKLVGAAAVGPRLQQTQSQQDVMPLQLEESIKQLLVESSRSTAVSRESSAAGAAGGPAARKDLTTDPQPQQQEELQQLQQQLHELEDYNAELLQQVDELVAFKEQSEQKLQQNALRLQQSEKLLAGMKAMRDSNKQLHQELSETRTQLDKALQEQQFSAVHLEQCRQQLTEARQQLANCEAERDTLMERMRELADRASAGGRFSPADEKPSSADLQQMTRAYAELGQQAMWLQKQLEDSQAKEERLQVVNAQLQERNAQLQEQISKLQVGADVAVLQAEHSQQQLASQQQILKLQQQINNQLDHIRTLQQQLHDSDQTLQQQHQQIQALQKQLQQKQQQLQDTEDLLQHQEGQVQGLQQQLQQREQQLQEMQHQQQLASAADGALAAQVEQLKVELDDRSRELEEWQIHADALEKDLADLKERAEYTDSLQQQLEQQQHDMACLEADRQQLQQELEATRNKVDHLEFDLHDVGKDHSTLLERFEQVTAELARVKENAADMRLRLEHFTGPAGPQARVKQLESSLQNMQRKYEAADARAAQAAARINELQDRLSAAEDDVIALDGQVNILETELAKYTQ